ncbi:chemoreceptor glutamine deamidase CheD [Corticimicrobacter populi]|uniref:Probable chemoreceptor glutamine deamidase CheD n=1 Tax=Corticimicrobacter populi TaxID=2175229 RepID=A0A2V1JTK2_9BURK|nr:chemoreceptor glutamine deamidase CheD [Corticimicrobacter populi]PWF21206.1 chemoreceptor glutamine deamidase CheD [Corticimicrobacter populi]
MKALGPDARATREYYDNDHQTAAVKILPNEYYVAKAGQGMMLTTVLGSCVAACIRDPHTGVGGMNHFMLPGGAQTGGDSTMRYGAYAMEVLINEILKAGAVRERLEAKVFGGGAVLHQMTYLDIGNRNSDFVLEYLKVEHIRIAAQDLRGTHARRVNYFPATGQVLVRKLAGSRDDADVIRQEDELQRFMGASPRAGRVELLGGGRKPAVGGAGTAAAGAGSSAMERLRAYNQSGRVELLQRPPKKEKL